MRLASGALLACFAAALSALAIAESLTLRQRNDVLFVSAQKLELIKGSIHDRLKNGSTVAFDFHLSLWAGTRNSLRRRSFDRFVVSYDLWEERYAAVSLRRPASVARGLTASSVGIWCLEQMTMPLGAIAREKNVWVRLDVRAPDPRQDSAVVGSEGLSLTGLVDWLSRPARDGETRWSLESGPLQPAEIRP